MSQLIGLGIEFKKELSPVTVAWKQGSFVGFGGDKSQLYRVKVYTIPATQKDIIIFVQDDKDAPKKDKIGPSYQYGCQNGILFLVLHDKTNTPYQHRFVQNKSFLAEWSKYLNDTAKSTVGVDLSWAAGDYLRDF